MLYFSIIVCDKVEFPLVVPLVLALLVIAEILVFVMASVLEKERSGIKTRSLWTGIRNFEIQDGEDVGILRRPGSESQSYGHAWYDLTLI